MSGLNILYEVVVFDEKSSANGSVLMCGSFEECCDFAQIHSHSGCLPLLVRPRGTKCLFVDGQKKYLQ